jgi:hypothetical protein
MMTATPRHRAGRVRVRPASCRGGAPPGTRAPGCVIAGMVGFGQAVCRTLPGEHSSSGVPWWSTRGRLRIAENLHELMDMPRVTPRPSEPEGGEKKPTQACSGWRNSQSVPSYSWFTESSSTWPSHRRCRRQSRVMKTPHRRSGPAPHSASAISHDRCPTTQGCGPALEHRACGGAILRVAHIPVAQVRIRWTSRPGSDAIILRLPLLQSHHRRPANPATGAANAQEEREEINECDEPRNAFIQLFTPIIGFLLVFTYLIELSSSGGTAEWWAGVENGRQVSASCHGGLLC